MATRSYIDTNVLVYAEASDEPKKQRQALALLKSLYEANLGVLSTQVLQEYATWQSRNSAEQAHRPFELV